MSCVNQRKKEHVRGVIFRRQHISRKELLEVTGYNWRSIVRYTEELKEQGLIYETQAVEEKRGRPTVVFHSNSEQVFFLGLTLVERHVTILVMTINGVIFHAETLTLEDGDRNSGMVSTLQAAIDGICQTHHDMALTGLGFNRCLYHQHHRQQAAFRKMAELAPQRYFVPVISTDNDSLLLHHLYRVNNLQGRAIGVVVGDELRMAEVSQGEIMETFGGYVQKLRHWCVAPESSEVCRCGQRGCLEAMLGDRGRIHRYYELIGGCMDESVISSKELYQLAEDGDVAALEILRQDAQLVVKLFQRVLHDQKPDHLFFFGGNHLLYREVVRQYEEIAEADAPRVRFCNCSITDGMCEIADLIRCHVLFFQQALG